MAKYFIGRPTLSKAATLSSIGNERASMPASNLQKNDPRLIWRSSGLGSLFIELDFGSPVALNFAALMFHRGWTDGTWQFRSDDTDPTSSPDHDSGSLNLWVSTNANHTAFRDRNALHSVYLFESAAVTNRFARIDITDANNPDGDFRAGVLMVGFGWRFTNNPHYGATAWQHVGRSIRSDNAGGGVSVQAEDPTPRLDFVPWFPNTAGEAIGRAEMFPLSHEAADHEPVLIVQDSDNADGYLIQRMGYYTLQVRAAIHSAFGLIEQPVTALGWT